jgi:hypothetical protein
MHTVEGFTRTSEEVEEKVAPSIEPEEIEAKKSKQEIRESPELPFDDEDDKIEQEESSITPSEHQDTMKQATTGIEDPNEMIAQGIRFFSSFARTLASPEKTQALVDTLVEQDPETGQTSLRIPVPDKESVVNVLNLFGKILGGVQSK